MYAELAQRHNVIYEVDDNNGNSNGSGSDNGNPLQPRLLQVARFPERI